MKSFKKLARVFFCAALVFAIVAVGSITALASEESATPKDIAANSNTNSATDTSKGLGYIAAALSTGLAAIGAGIAVGSGAPAAIGALTEDPKSFGKSLIFVALGEGIALYGMLISILILNS